MSTDVMTQAETSPDLVGEPHDLDAEMAVLVDDRPPCDRRRRRSFRDG